MTIFDTTKGLLGTLASSGWFRIHPPVGIEEHVPLAEEKLTSEEARRRGTGTRRRRDEGSSFIKLVLS